MCTDTLACEALTCTRCSRTLFPQDMDAGAEEAPRRAPNIAAAPSRFALMSGTQLSHRAFVIVLVSRSRASLGVALSTCQLSLLAVALWMCLPTVGGYPRHVVLRSPSGAEPWHTVLWNPPKGLDYCGCVYPQMLNNMTVDVFTHRC